ncbi:MAG: hypothetical protein ACXWJL_08270 [Xanthobacteraceae bacterium]
MKIAVDLRSDLAKLSDAELANHLKENWQIYEAPAFVLLWTLLTLTPASLDVFISRPIRHRRAYRFLAAIGCADETWLSLLFATVEQQT